MTGKLEKYWCHYGCIEVHARPNPLHLCVHAAAKHERTDNEDSRTWVLVCPVPLSTSTHNKTESIDHFYSCALNLTFLAACSLSFSYSYSLSLSLSLSLSVFLSLSRSLFHFLLSFFFDASILFAKRQSRTKVKLLLRVEIDLFAFDLCLCFITHLEHACISSRNHRSISLPPSDSMYSSFFLLMLVMQRNKG